MLKGHIAILREWMHLSSQCASSKEHSLIFSFVLHSFTDQISLKAINEEIVHLHIWAQTFSVIYISIHFTFYLYLYSTFKIIYVFLLPGIPTARLTKPQQTGVLLTQLGMGLIIILW